MRTGTSIAKPFACGSTLHLSQGRRDIPASQTPKHRDLREHAAAAFTVLELLMVMGVLSVLLAIVLPTIKTVRASALRKQAKIEATALAQAVIRYKNEYGFWPGQLRAKDDDTVELIEAFKQNQTAFITAIISGPEEFTRELAVNITPIYLNGNELYRAFRQVGRKEGAGFKPNPLNPKGIRFLDLENESDPDRTIFRDPWGGTNVVFMGLNPRSTFTVRNSGMPSYSVSVSNAIAFAFSFGADGKNSTNYIYSAGVGP